MRRIRNGLGWIIGYAAFVCAATFGSPANLSAACGLPDSCQASFECSYGCHCSLVWQYSHWCGFGDCSSTGGWATVREYDVYGDAPDQQCPTTNLCSYAVTARCSNWV